ncbi:MAG: PAS domain S-box protein [Nitrospirae bacterium]|nr:PAS domain S-box protein [Candidatus Manganitrophaceae bacterium]
MGKARRDSEPLLQSLESYRHLVEEVKDYAIYLLDLQGKVMSWNQGAERIKGYRPEEIIGKHFSAFYTKDDQRRGKPAYNLSRALEEGRFEEEGWRIRKDGSRFWANIVITRLENDEGKRIGFAKITRDLTERRQAEQRHRLLVEGVRDYAIFMLDPQGRVVSWNRGAVQIKGYQLDEIIGKHFSVFYPDEDKVWDKAGYELKRAVEDGQFEDEGWRVRKDGSRFWASAVITPIRNEEGELIGFSKLTRDLTERREAEERLRKSQAQLSVAQRIAHIGSWEWEIASNTLTWSDELYRIYGLSSRSEGMTYDRYLTFLHPEDLASVKEIIEKAYQNGQTFAFEHRIVRPDGIVRILHSQGEVLLNKEGKPVRMFGTAQDITERKQVENAIRKLNEELEIRVRERTAELQTANEALQRRTHEAEEASRLKSQFVSNVSHELRTPLNSILGYATLMHDETFGPVGSDQKKPLEGILRNADDLLHLIEEVLDLSRMEAGRLKIQRSSFDLHDLIEEVISGMQPLIDERGLYLKQEVEETLSTLETDAGKVKQILVNLLSNAVKFTRHGGITLTARKAPRRDGVEVAVSDTGIGMKPEALPRIFEAFYQLDADLTREFGGVGLGLRIVKDLVNLLEGEIRVESEQGKGSTFTVFLPCRLNQ